MLLLALALRVYRLDAQSLWYDEAVTAQVAGRGIAELTRWTADDIQPPLYYYVVAGWTRLAGRSEWALRFPSACFGILTVPLLWAAGRRLFGRRNTGRWAAGLAALLAATLPLYVYYAQEARMYTLLTFLGALAGYALLRTTARKPGAEDREQGTGAREQATEDRQQETEDKGARETSSGRPGGFAPLVVRATGSTWWLVFVLAAAALLYTHYFGIFLLGAYGICWLAWWTLTAHATRLRSLTAFAISALTIIVLYLPWLPAMLNRYRADASYWRGALKLGEALRHVAINFSVAAPEMMLESEAVRLLPIFGGAFALALISLFWQGRHARQASLLLIVLLVPIIAVLFLASRTPKFNPRYLMLASPAYVLLLAGGVSALRGRREKPPTRQGMQHATRSTPYAIRHTSALLLTAFLVAASLVSLRNWFTDPAFTKAQWRELTALVRAERAPDEAVLLVSGHAYPAWDYYAADIPVVRLPQIEILDVNAVLDFGVGAELATALAGKKGAWLVSWQDEVVDPVGIVPYLLERAGAEQEVPRSFWHLKLRHWRLQPDAAFPTEPQPQHLQGANFDHKLALLGWDDPVGGEIIMYWRVLNMLTQDYQIALVIEDAAGNRLGQWDGRPAGYHYPTFRWRPGQVLFGRYPLPLPAGAAAGDYTITLTVYDPADPSGLDIRDVADNPAGKQARLGPVRMRGD